MKGVIGTFNQATQVGNGGIIGNGCQYGGREEEYGWFESGQQIL